MLSCNFSSNDTEVTLKLDQRLEFVTGLTRLANACHDRCPSAWDASSRVLRECTHRL